MKLVPLPYKWVGNCPYEDELREALALWDSTPYAPDQQCAQVGVDCVRFVCAIMDQISGRSTNPRTLPQDAAMHDRAGAVACMKQIMTLYKPIKPLGPHYPYVRGGDVLIVGRRTGGPGHAMIVGPDQNTIWHATFPRVQRTGMYLDNDHKVFRVYRYDWEGDHGRG